MMKYDKFGSRSSLRHNPNSGYVDTLMHKKTVSDHFGGG